MKIKSILAAALAALTFAACSSSNDDEFVENIVPNGEETTVTVSLTTAFDATRAPSGTEAPTADEEAVKSATLYVFNATKELELVEPLTVTSGVAEKTLKITTGTHYFYAVVNPQSVTPTHTTAANKGNYMEDIIKSIMTVTDVTSLYSAGAGYMMTNVDGPVAKNIVTATEAEAPTKNPVILKVGRVLAKVNLQKSLTLRQPSTGELTNIEYLVANNPKQVYMLPFFDGDYLKTPFFNTATVNTANYFPAIPAITEPASNLTGFKAINNNGIKTNYFYATENSNLERKAGNSTRIMVKGKFVPKANSPEGNYTFDKDGNPAPLDASGTFYRLRSKADASVWVDKIYKESVVGGTEATEYPLASYDVIEYTNGICYYDLYLKDNAETDEVKSYTVPRNSYWNVTLTHISGIGRSHPDGEVDPPTIAFIHGSITVLPWARYDMNGSI